MNQLTTNRKGELTYKVSGRHRQVYQKDTFNDLSKSFMRDYRKGLVKQMPQDWLYNSTSNRFYENTQANKEVSAP